MMHITTGFIQIAARLDADAGCIGGRPQILSDQQHPPR